MEDVTFAKDLDVVCGVAVTDDGQHVVITNSSRLTVFSSTGEVVRRFGRHGSGPRRLRFPWGVAVSADKHIFVADVSGGLQKFSFSFQYEASANVCGYGVAIHPSGKIFTTACVGDPKIQVFNDDLTLSYSFSCTNVDRLTDIAIDTKGMVYVTDPSKGNVLKFTPEGKHLTSLARYA